MSWNRKDWLKLAGLLGLGATGAGLAGIGPMAGLLGCAGKAAGAAAVTGVTQALTPGLAATGPTSQAAMLAAQNAGLGFDALAKTAQAAAGAQGVSPMARMGAQALGAANTGLDAFGKVGKVAGAMGPVAGLMAPSQPPPPPGPPPQNNFQPTPTSSPYGGLRDAPPPGIDPRQWAMMSPEQKRMMMMGRM